jgi:eukaryotic-like serine/threonine-protein kinase
VSDIRLGAFRLLRPIAEGGMAVVWGGLHESELPVAVKVLTGGDLRAPMVRSVFRNEVRAVAKLDHPGIISILDFGEVTAQAAAASEGRLAEGSPYLVMEYAAGGSLGKRKRRWSWTALRRLIVALLDALAHAHAHGVIHRDLKPGNILLAGPDDQYGGVKLTDFGIAWVGAGRDLQALAGTVQYMAPEQHADDYANYGPWTDLYALGCLVWRLSCGHTPFAHAGRQVARAHTFERPPRFDPRFPVPDGFERWVRTLLHKAPLARYRTAADARAGLFALPTLDDKTEAADLGDQEEDESAVTRGDGSTSPVPVPAQTGLEPGEEVPPTAIAVLATDWRTSVPPRPPLRLRGAGLGLMALREMPVFGRTRQRDLLWKGLRGVHDEGEPRLVLVRGPSGCGKSRLVEWIAQRADEDGGIRTLWVRGDDIAGAVVAMLGLERLSGDERAEEVVERLEGPPSTEGGPPTTSLGWLPALQLGLSEQGTQDPTSFRAAVLRLLEHVSRDRPAMLVVDDAHAADEALELAREGAASEDLQGSTRRRAVLVVLIARDDGGLAERPDVARRIDQVIDGSRARRVRLGPLESPARRRLLEYLGLSGALAARVDERAKGNPQFAIQLVDDWIQRGLLVPGPDGFVLADPEAEPPIPDDLHEIWSARVAGLLAGLPGIAAIHFERAAALGMEVDAEEWAIACDDPQARRKSEVGVRLRGQLLERLRDAMLVEEGPRGFRFAHPMLRECVERSSRKARRWASHHQAIATLLAGNVVREPARIGLHRLEAGEPGPAVDLLLEGIDQALRRSRTAQAASALIPLERAMREADVAPDDERWAWLWCRQAGVLRDRGLLAEALAQAERARDLADREGREEVWSACMREVSRIRQEEGDVPLALASMQDVAARLARAGLRGRELAVVLTRMAVLARMTGRLDDAERWASQANGVLARSGVEDSGLEGYIIGELAVLACRRGRYDRALALFEEALPVLRAADQPSRLAEVENNRGDALKQLGRWGEAEAAYLEAVRILEMIGTAPEIPKINLALCALHSGRYDEARLVAREAAQIGSRVNAALALLALAVADAALGDLGAVGRALSPALQTLRRARFVDPDAAWLAEVGADRAAAAGAIDEAGLFAFFAREQLSTMGDEAGVARISRVLAGLDVRRRRG